MYDTFEKNEELTMASSFSETTLAEGDVEDPLVTSNEGVNEEKQPGWSVGFKTFINESMEHSNGSDLVQKAHATFPMLWAWKQSLKVLFIECLGMPLGYLFYVLSVEVMCVPIILLFLILINGNLLWRNLKAAWEILLGRPSKSAACNDFMWQVPVVLLSMGCFLILCLPVVALLSADSLFRYIRYSVLDLTKK